MTKDVELASIAEFCRRLDVSRATYYRMLKRGIPNFPKPVKPSGPGRSNPSKVIRSEMEAYLDGLWRKRDGVRPVGRPKKDEAA